LFSAAAVLQPATAQPNRARQGVQSGEVRSLDQILGGIRRERPGSLADVEGPNPGPSGEPHYRLKWLTPDGRVLWLDTDARTGRVLGVQGDDRGPGPGAAPRSQNPREAQGFRRNMNPPPGDQYDFSAPGIRPPRGAPPGRPMPQPGQGFGRGPADGGQGPPPPRARQPRPQSFDRGPPPRMDRPPPPPQQRFDRGPDRNRGSFDRGAPSAPRSGFRNGSSFGGGGFGGGGGPRMPRGEPRNPRSFR